MRLEALSTILAGSIGVVLLTGLVSCSDSSPTDSGDPVRTTAVEVDDNVFNPDAIRVDAGATVDWTWVGSNPHDVTWDDADLSDSQTQTSGSHQVTMPTEPGEYSYHCTVHVFQGMRGTVVVE